MFLEHACQFMCDGVHILFWSSGVLLMIWQQELPRTAIFQRVSRPKKVVTLLNYGITVWIKASWSTYE